MDKLNEGTAILVGTDFSMAADRALDEAIRLARKLSAPVELVHICQPAMFTRDGEVGRLLRAGNRLEALRAQVAAKVPAGMHLHSGDPVSGLLSVILDLRPTLVIVGTHHRNPALRHLLGSVTGRLCHQSPVPVLVVPAPGLDAPHNELAGGLDFSAAHLSIARSCTRCGHIRGTLESENICSRCRSQPARWNSAPMSVGAEDAEEEAVGQCVLDGTAGWAASNTTEPFWTCPPGTSGYGINAELRIRY